MAETFLSPSLEEGRSFLSLLHSRKLHTPQLDCCSSSFYTRSHTHTHTHTRTERETQARLLFYLSPRRACLPHPSSSLVVRDPPFFYSRSLLLLLSISLAREVTPPPSASLNYSVKFSPDANSRAFCTRARGGLERVSKRESSRRRRKEN